MVALYLLLQQEVIGSVSITEENLVTCLDNFVFAVIVHGPVGFQVEVPPPVRVHVSQALTIGHSLHLLSIQLLAFQDLFSQDTLFKVLLLVIVVVLIVVVLLPVRAHVAQTPKLVAALFVFNFFLNRNTDGLIVPSLEPSKARVFRISLLITELRFLELLAADKVPLLLIKIGILFEEL